MTLEERVTKLERNYKNLNESFLKSQRSNNQTVARVDGNSNDIVSLTPYTETKTAYIGDTEIVFTDVPEGNVTVFGIDEQVFRVKRIGNTIRVSFEPLEEVTEITISIS